MQIDRAAIFRFGKLADRTVDFAPGINIVYGKTKPVRRRCTRF